VTGEWQPLFDGVTTEGWTRCCHGAAFPNGSWRVEDGCLRAVPGTYLSPDIATARRFDNFELELEWRISPGGNSGVFYSLAPEPRFLTEYYVLSALAIGLPLLAMLLFRRRIVLLAAIAAVACAASIYAGHALWAKASGFEMQVLDDTRHWDARNPARSAGSLYGVIAPENKQLRPVGEFNQVRLLVNVTRVEQWLNGVKVVEFDIDSPDFQRRVLASPLSRIRGFGEKRVTPIALQHHGDAVWFRNIRVRVLSN
jgi:hypothetical protein